MTTSAVKRSGMAIVIWGIALGVATVLVYWFAAQADEYLEFGVLTAVVLGAMAVASGAAIGSTREVARWSTWESVLSAVLAGVIGLIFWAWGLTVWKLLGVVKSAIPGYGMAIRDLFYGAWFLAAILVPYIVRRPGAAVAAEVVAAIISALLGAEWGLTVLISGLAQGGLAEIVFALRGYKHYDLPTLIIASVAAALGSGIVDYAFWYSKLEVHILILMLVARFISAAIFSGLLGKVISDALAATGVLDNTALGRARVEA